MGQSSAVAGPEVRFGPAGPLTVDGEPVALDDHPRFDNPFARVPWGATTYEIEADGHRLVLDFEAGTRIAG